MAAPRPEYAHATDHTPVTTFPPRPAHTTIGRLQDRRPVVSKLPHNSCAATKMSPHIRTGPEPVLTTHARSPPAAGSHCLAGADSAPHLEQNFNPVHCKDDDVFYLFLQKQKIGAELHIYLEEGTYHKRLFRGPNTNDIKK